MCFEKTYLQKVSHFILTLIISILLIGCSSDSGVDPNDPEDPGNGNGQPTGRGAIVSSESIGTYSTTLLQSLLDLYNIELGVDLTYSVEAYKVVYLTVDADGTEVQASGAVLVPTGANNLPILSSQHGTQPERDMVASEDPLNSIDAIIAASVGYFACSPDYLGLGVSTTLHPYHLESTSASSVIDCIRAAKNFASDNSITLNGQLFLAGYSEGGYVTMAAHKAIESGFSSEFTITACAPMAGAYDLKGTADEILQSGTYGSPVFLSFMLLAYNDTYGWNRLDNTFQAPYNSTITGLFDGTHSTGEINNQLPADLTQLFTESFMTNYLDGTDTQLISALESNSLLDWTPIAPMRLFHGDADVTVPYQNAVTAHARLTANGAVSLDLVTIPGGDHGTSISPCITGMVEWFETFRTTAYLAKAN